MRIIMSGVAIYTTAKQIRDGMFGFVDQNLAAYRAFADLEKLHFSAQPVTGLGGTYHSLQVQLDLL